MASELHAALHELHRAGWYHGDLSPRNVMWRLLTGSSGGVVRTNGFLPSQQRYGVRHYGLRHIDNYLNKTAAADILLATILLTLKA